MLRGAHSVTLDGKGRLAIPTKYRSFLEQECANRYVCTIDIQNPCLLLFPLNKWEILEQKLSTLSSTNLQERRLQRILLGYASDCEADSNGRILVPAVLREHANLNKDIMLIGQLNRFEIWSESNWKASIADDLTQLSQDNAWDQTDRLREFSLNDN